MEECEIFRVVSHQNASTLGGSQQLDLIAGTFEAQFTGANRTVPSFLKE